MPFVSPKRGCLAPVSVVWRRLLLVGTAVLLASAAPASAQDPTRAIEQHRVALAPPASDSVSQLVVLRNGTTLLGRTIAIVGDSVRFASNVGTVSFALADVEEVRLVAAGDIRDGRYWFPNPNDTRLLFAPTARMLRRGEGYFSSYYVFLPGVAYGVTDRFTIGGGISLIPGVDLNDQLLYITPKIGLVDRGNVQLAAGALVATIPFSDDNDGFEAVGVLYGVGTTGSADRNLTLGLGFGFAGSDVESSPAVMLGGQTRVSRRFALVSENYYFPAVGDGALVSYGGRFMGERIAVDLGFFNLIGNDTGVIFPGFPFIGLVFNF